MFITPYLFQSEKSTPQTHKAVIVLPEIFGLTKSIREVADRFAEEFQCPAFALDFFYTIDETPHDLDYTQGLGEGIELMQQMKGEKFLEILEKAKEEIRKIYPEIKEFSICGFCFGGKLAYLSGSDQEVTEVISFYGARSNLPFIEEESVITYTTKKREHDKNLRILSLFGSMDESIGQEDRNLIKTQFAGAGIRYNSYEFPTGHAFFNMERETYHKKSAEEAWTIIQNFLQR